jgi:CRISPR/Cas system-associated endonuclease Cas3-HD
MEAVICKTVDALSDVRGAMNKMQREAGMMNEGMCEVVAATLKTHVEMHKMQREAGTVRRELDQLRAEVAEMKRKERFRELVAQEARLVFSDAGDVRRRAAREAAFEG